VGKGRYYGAELGPTYRIGSTIEIGGNCSYIHCKLDSLPATGVPAPMFQLTDVPTHKGFAYAS
jgi:iron complex outermembrane receptor protein